MKFSRASYLFALAGMLFFLSCQNPSSSENSGSKTEQSEASSQSEPGKTDMTLVNPNLATAEDMVKAGLTTDLADAIINDRPFLTMTDLDSYIGDQIDSIGKASLYTQFFVPFNLNTTPEKEFKLIPGVGDRMAHEFEEYRPYLKIDQFRREIGKYVDENEVARYERYVFVPIELNTATEEEILAIPGVGDRMAHEFEEYRPYENLEQFRREIGKYVDNKELARLERFVYLKD